jgi:hypothetical protein
MAKSVGPQKEAILLRLDPNHPMVKELFAEAKERSVSVQQHIFDLLQARHLARHGKSLSTLLWVPSESRAPTGQGDVTQDEAADPGPELSAASQQQAAMWLNMLGDEEE